MRLSAVRLVGASAIYTCVCLCIMSTGPVDPLLCVGQRVVVLGQCVSGFMCMYVCVAGVAVHVGQCDSCLPSSQPGGSGRWRWRCVLISMHSAPFWLLQWGKGVPVCSFAATGGGSRAIHVITTEK